MLAATYLHCLVIIGDDVYSWEIVPCASFCSDSALDLLIHIDYRECNDLEYDLDYSESHTRDFLEYAHLLRAF